MLHWSPTTLLLLTSLPFILTAPSPHAEANNDWSGSHGGKCLSPSEASFLVDIMVSVSVEFDPNYVAPYFADDFTVQSDSINAFIGLGTGVLTASNKAVFIAASYNQTIVEHPPPIVVENIVVACDEVAFRWQSQNKPVVTQGIDIIKCVYNAGLGHWQIETDYSEFNSVALLIDTGAFPCKS